MRTAQLLELGVSPGELRGPGWRTPFYGVHAPAGDSSECELQRILDAAELVPAGGAIGGWAAAWLLGARELDGRGRSGREREPVLILSPKHLTPAGRPGVQFLRSRLDDGDAVAIRGIPVTAAVRTTFDLARLAEPEDALVAADVMARSLGVRPVDVLRYVERHPRFRGVPTVRLVLDLVDPRSRSTGESRLRWIWVVEAGLPRPQCNAYVLDDVVVVAMPDLLDVSCGLVGEYDGATHRELEEHTYDNVREEDLERLGLVVVRATSVDVGVRRDRTVSRLLDGYRRAQKKNQRAWGWRPSRIRRGNSPSGASW
jgi:hypothetical protein